MKDRHPAAFDRDALMRRGGGDEQLAGELLLLFVKHGLADAARLIDGAEGAERAGLAHRLKGAARIVGADEIAALAAAIEEGAAADGLGDAVARFRAALAAGE